MDKEKRMQKCRLLITDEAVREALKKDKGSEAQLTSWKIEDFTKKGDNYATMVTSVKVEFSLAGKEDRVSYVVKTNPCHGFQILEKATVSAFEKEAEFYMKLLPQLNSVLEEVGLTALAMPQGYYGKLEKSKQLIFLEDLRARGFKMFERRKGLDTAHTTLVLKELAKLHSASLLLEKKNPEYHKDSLLHKGWYNYTETEGAIMPMHELNIDKAIQVLKKIGGYESTIKWLEGLKSEAREIIKKEMEPCKYQVLLHGDVWNNNLLFRYNEKGVPTEVMLVDLQMCRRESFAIDLNHLLFTGLTGDVRKPNLEAFLETYRQEFNSVMEAGGGEVFLGKDDVMEGFRSKNKIGMIYTMMIVGPLLIDPEGVLDLQSLDDGGEEDLDRYSYDLHQKVLDSLPTDPLLGPRFLSIFDELTEAGIITT